MAVKSGSKSGRRKPVGAPAPAESAGDALADYRRKRDFAKTAEPAPGGGGDGPHRKPVFVVQEHHASTLHYDFRLESDGVLKSWAVPKEPSMDPSVKRLAVRVEDHPLAYATFTGDIPAGQYGAGHVEIWDHGTWSPPDGSGEPSVGGASLSGALEAGKVEFVLHGRKLEGGFTLVRAFGGGRGAKGRENWLLIKRKDDHARPGDGDGKDSRPPGTAAARPRRSRAAAKTVRVESEGEPREVEFTHADKVMFPGPGFTKGDVLDYYRRVANKLLPHLRDRPITLERLPDGVRDGAPRFWQKNTPAYYPPWVPRVDLPAEGGKPVKYALVNDVRTLLYLVNQGALTFHPFFSRVQDLDRPDYVLFDLDPGEATFADVVTVARRLRDLLADEGLEPLVKTSGKSGLHVPVPWARPGGYDEARAWALGVAGKLVKALPDVATTERSKAGRGGRVYVDVMQNARGHHAVPPYVLRAVPAATVSTPLEWKEVTPKLNPGKFTLATASRRFARQATDPMARLIGS